MDDKFLLKKTIYAKRKVTTKQQVIDIMELEIQTHLRDHPDVAFKKIGEPVTNEDKSLTYPIHFTLKQRP